MDSSLSKATNGGDHDHRDVDPQSPNETVISGGETSSVPPGGSPVHADQWIGRRLGKYDVRSVLGVGGMGVVLRGYDSSIEREVAIKVLPAELAADEVALRRFLAEAQSAGKLNHANTVTIYDVASEGATHYLVMEIVAGGSAEDVLKRSGAYSVSDATRMTIEACQGLAAAHRVGLIHRDVKPANLLLTEDGTVKVSDFGLAKRTRNQTLQMTQIGQIIGTPYYMSPEQCEARDVDPRSDVYSLGATYYSLLTGKCPYEETGSAVQVMFAHCNAAPPDPREIRANVPAACVEIIERAMATDPDQRYQSMEEMCGDLEAVLAAMSGADVRLPSRTSTHRRSVAPGGQVVNRRAVIAGAAGILALVGLGAFFLFSSKQAEQPEGAGPDEGQAGTQPAGADSAPGGPPTGEPIKVGILHSLSGTMANSEAPVVDAALLAIEELNDAGGLLGRPIQALVADGRSDSAAFAEEATRLIREEQVCTVFGCWTSDSRKTVVPIFEEANHLLVYPVQYEGIEESPNVIYTGSAPNQQIIPAVKWAYAFENKRKFFLVGSDYVFPRVAHEIIKDELDQLGAECVGDEFVPLGGMDVQGIVDKIVETGPDMILNSINGDSNRPFFAALRQAGVTPDVVPTISFSIGEEELRHVDVASMVGDYAAWNYFQSMDSPENVRFVSTFQQKYGPQRVVTAPMAATYIGIKIWGKSVIEAESVEPSAIRREMRNQRMSTPAGEVRIDPSTQHTFKTPRIGRVRPDGQFDVVWTAASPVAPIPYPATRTAEQWRAFLHDLYSGWGDRWSAPGP